MKDNHKSLIGFFSFIGLMIITVLEIVSIIANKETSTIAKILDDVKNLCILFVFGYSCYNYVINRKNWLKIVYYVCMSIVFLVSILNLII